MEEHIHKKKEVTVYDYNTCSGHMAVDFLIIIIIGLRRIDILFFNQVLLTEECQDCANIGMRQFTM